VLKHNLKNQIKHMKDLKQFLATCESEALLSDDETKAEETVPGGLGLVFEFPGDPKKLKDRSKTKLWKQYLQGTLESLYSIEQTFTVLTQLIESKWAQSDDDARFKLPQAYSSWVA
jgi:hypothetical protein